MNGMILCKGVNPSENLGVSSFPSHLLFSLPLLSSLPLPRAASPPKPAKEGLGSAVSSPSGDWGKAPADNRFAAYPDQKEQLCFAYLIILVLCVKTIKLAISSRLLGLGTGIYYAQKG